VITLIGLDGIVRARRAGQKSSFGEDMHDTKLFAEQAKSRNDSFLGAGIADGVVRFVSFRTLAQYPLIVVVGTSEAETLASFHERERRYYLTAGFASTMIVIFAAFIMAALSRRKRAEETARASENRLRLALSNINMAVFHQDRSLRYTWMYQPQMSYLPEQVIGHTDAELLPPEATRRVTELKQRVIEKGEIVHDEICVAGKDATFFYDLTAEPLREASGAIIGLTGVTLDITERKRADQAALDQFKLAETIFNHSVSCFVVLDRNFNFLRVNDAYARACRRDIGEFAGRNHFDLYPSDAKAIFEEVVRTRKPFEIFVNAFAFPDQPERGLTYWEWTLVPVLDAQGEVEYLVFSLNEITERTRAREVLKQSLQRVQALSERVMKIQQEERDRIARELHDELGQTLTALKVTLQMLEPYCADGEAEDHLTEALVITGRALEQVRGMLLDLRPLGLEDLGLAVVLESHLAKQAEAAGWDAQFETTLPGRLRPELEMACFRVAQEALTNVMRHAHAKQVWVALGLKAGEVQLSVRDDGDGFDVAVVSDVSRTGGFGLIGMQERVRQLGGRLAIHSAPGRGTEVRASFPCEPAGGREADANAQTHA
jgi:PAS domain S-box-containing protein